MPLRPLRMSFIHRSRGGTQSLHGLGHAPLRAFVADVVRDGAKVHILRLQLPAYGRHGRALHLLDNGQHRTVIPASPTTFTVTALAAGSDVRRGVR